ncbi:stage V sporulation protein AB [Paenibacillus sp. 1_12]|uniref:stage V sporulation protein AB n=1 Tax=Paenibacillus sp. 1_12 TaxID=1566278 RepID=UPI0008F42537|nr:stage V sporulation protein AB [Paenibacillus sp. 1_12]SFK92832.1 stage V sporulation protein AB [Paenibacillus sp. 1_12]
MNLWWLIPVQLFIGLAGGIAVGSGMVAFLVVLDIIPRLAQITRSYRFIRAYEWSVIGGSLFFTVSDFFVWSFSLHPFTAILLGLLAGGFVGMLAGALTEVMNVLPILAKRVGMASYMLWLLMAMVFGKVLGSLLDWLHVLG